MVGQREQLRLAVVEAVLRCRFEHRVVLHLHGGMNALQLHHVGLGEILAGRLRGEIVTAVIAGEPGRYGAAAS